MSKKEQCTFLKLTPGSNLSMYRSSFVTLSVLIRINYPIFRKKKKTTNDTNLYCVSIVYLDTQYMFGIRILALLLMKQIKGSINLYELNTGR